MLEVIGAGSSKRVGPRDWKDIWADSAEFAQLQEDIEVLKAEGAARDDEVVGKPTTCEDTTVCFLRVLSTDFGST